MQRCLVALGLVLAGACGRTIAVPGDPNETRLAGGSGPEPAAPAGPVGASGSGAGGAGGLQPGAPVTPPSSVAGAGGSSSLPPGMACDASGWCCDPMGWCCNQDLGVCQGTAPPPGPPAAGGIPVPPPPPPPPPPDVVPGGPDLGSCVSAASTTSTGYCDVAYDCEGGSVFASCNDGGDSWYCTCESNLGFHEYRMTSDTGIARCDVVAAYCMGGSTLDGEVETCTPSSGSTSSTSCNTDLECRRSVHLAGDVTLDEVDYQSVYCNLVGDVWTCECNTSMQYLRFDLEADVAGPEVCNDIVPLCDSEAIAIVGEPQCTARSQYVDPNFCEVELDCTREGFLGDWPVRVHESRYTNCQWLTGTTWSCSCEGAADATQFGLDGDAGWQVCERAGDECARR